MTSKDKLTILENVIGRVGLGGDVLSEYSKALSMYGQIETENLMSQNVTLSPPVTPPPMTENIM